MDQLKVAWKNIQPENVKDDIDRIKLEEIINTKSKSPMDTLRQRVLIKWYFSLFFTLVLVVGIPFVDVLVSQILLSILLMGYVFGDVMLYQEYRQLKKVMNMDDNIRDTLEAYRKRVKNVLYYEELVGLTLYPISLSAGFFLSGFLSDPEGFMTERTDWVFFVIMLVILVPASHFLARWMNRVSFGKYLNQLDENIKELQTL
jgi:hypothetical protein